MATLMSLSTSLRRNAVACLRTRRSSAVARSLQEESMFLPTRHSRHAPPPTCLDASHLTALTQEVLESGPGSLFTYDRSHDEDAWAVQEVDATVQKVEYLVRGHAARIPRTLANQLYAAETDEDAAEHLTDMDSLMKRIQKEGEDYVKLRKEMTAQLIPVDTDSNSPDERDEFDFEDDMEEAEFIDESEQSTSDMLGQKVGAPPGLTVSMVDTYLDGMAVAPTGSCPPSELSDLLYKTVARYQADGGQEFNTNVHTTPTILTFNAILRALSTNLDLKSDEKTRDSALQLGIGMYDSMRHIVNRNSATYTYLLKLIEQCLPPSKSRGNIAYGLFMQATQESVVDGNVMDAVREVQSKASEEFEKWARESLPSEPKDMSLYSRRDSKRRRYRVNDSTY